MPSLKPRIYLFPRPGHPSLVIGVDSPWRIMSPSTLAYGGLAAPPLRLDGG
ncbi:MAG: hypothetical protein ACYDBQ_06850 [Thermoplasmatota archaeon]